MVVQSRTRGLQARKSLASRQVKAKEEAVMTEEKVVVVQSRTRGLLARKSLASRQAKAKAPATAPAAAMSDDKAAVVVQSSLRGFIARRQTAEKKTKSPRDGSGKSRKSRRNPFESFLAAKTHAAHKASEAISKARMKANKKALRMLIIGWIEGAAEVDPYSTPEEIETGKKLWMNLLDECIRRMEAKELEVKGVGSARLRAVIQRDQHLETWPPPPPVFPNPLIWLRAKALYALLPADKDIWYFILKERWGCANRQWRRRLMSALPPPLHPRPPPPARAPPVPWRARTRLSRSCCRPAWRRPHPASGARRLCAGCWCTRRCCVPTAWPR